MNDDKLAISTTTDGKPARPGFENASAPSPIGSDGQHESYWVLSQQERARGFVRPVRNKYIHIGRAVCGKIKRPDHNRLGGMLTVCALPPGHGGECWVVSQELSQPDAARAEQEHVIGGCGTETHMGAALSETYARDPSYYGATFCCHCRNHFPVGKSGEFVWSDTDERVGT